MTLFINTPNRKLEISEIYIMELTFLIFFAVTKIFKSVVKKQIEKQKRNNPKNVNIVNPRGGTLGIGISDDTKLAYTILSCIANNQRYLTKDPKAIRIIFALTKSKIKKESLITSPDMMRFLALTLINKNQTLVVKVANIIVSSNNIARLGARMVGSAIIRIVSVLAAPIPYAVFMLVLFHGKLQLQVF